jgi:cobalt/nickel transport system permease protein
MHIPDGYLGPPTYIALYAAFVGFMAVALKKVKTQLTARAIPFAGMASAFSFLIMMFNIPIPGGTTGHATGAALIAILLGPWIASVAVSVAVIIQALVFGDGGITAIGANCFNMAVFMPFVSYYIFVLSGGNRPSINRKAIAAFVAGYLGLALTSVITAVEFGLQPLLSVSSEGQPLYAPYPLGVAIPAMAAGHLLVFGIAEGLVTSLVVRHFFKNYPDDLNKLKT